MLSDVRKQDLVAINEFDKDRINSFLLEKIAAEEFKKTKCYSYILWKYFLYHLKEGFIKRANDGRQRSLKPRVVYSNQIPAIGGVETPQLQKGALRPTRMKQ
jgi:hypothetical protein